MKKLLIVALCLIGSGIINKTKAQWPSTPDANGGYSITQKIGVGAISSATAKAYIYTNGETYGLNVSQQNTASSTRYGISANVNGNNNSNTYGIYTNMTGGGTGNKYGFYSNCNIANGYAGYFYNNNANGYSGYFVGRSYFSDNVGFGTTTPEVKIDASVGNTHSANAVIRITKPFAFQLGAGVPDLFLVRSHNVSGGGFTSIFTIQSNHNVGIGVATAYNKLDISGKTVIGSGYAGQSGILAPANGLLVEGKVGIGTTTPFTTYQATISGGLFLQGGTSTTPAAVLVCSHSTNPADEGFKVFSDGKVYAREVTVTLNAFPDYVFKKDYELKSIEQVSSYIQEEGHLPGIPSADEVLSNGIGMGELQVKSVEKIEELTLYIIQLNERLKVLEKENSELKELLLKK